MQVLLNDHQVTPAQKMLHRALGTKRKRKSFAYECHHGCRSTGENLHTKFYLFSHTGGAFKTVMTGSVNLTGNSAMNQYNDLYVVNNAAKLTKKFRVLWGQLKKDKPAHPGWLVQKAGPHFRVEATPFPHPGPHHDPIISILNKVHCLGATDGTGNKVHHTVVRVVMHAWNDERGHYIAQKMRQLYGHGCDVKLQYGFAGSERPQHLRHEDRARLHAGAHHRQGHQRRRLDRPLHAPERAVDLRPLRQEHAHPPRGHRVQQLQQGRHPRGRGDLPDQEPRFLPGRPTSTTSSGCGSTSPRA